MRENFAASGGDIQGDQTWIMDMQMPVMDGLAATRRIRSLQCVRRMPIVAMTANAMEKDRTRCIEAGMDDFLVKPIEPENLWGVLLRWVRASGAGAGDTCLASPRNGETCRLPESVPGLDMALGLARMGGKRKLYATLLRRYCDGQRESVRQIRGALAARDLQAARLGAHTLKGVSGNIGATGIQALAGAVELAIAEDRPPGEIDSCLAALGLELQKLVEDLADHLAPAIA